MPLTQCPECGGKVSDRAPACPHCGCPVEARQDDPQAVPSPDSATPGDQPHGSTWGRKFVSVVGMVVLLICCAAVRGIVKTGVRKTQSPATSAVPSENGPPVVVKGNFFSRFDEMEVSLEQAARIIAEQNMRNRQAVVRDNVADAQSYSDGICVVNEIIMNLPGNISKQQIRQLDKYWQDNVTDVVCAENMNDPYFYNGLYYLYVYKDTKGAVLSRFTISHESCGNLEKFKEYRRSK